MVEFDVTSVSAVALEVFQGQRGTAFHLEGVPTLAPFATPH